MGARQSSVSMSLSSDKMVPVSMSLSSDKMEPYRRIIELSDIGVRLQDAILQNDLGVFESILKDYPIVNQKMSFGFDLHLDRNHCRTGNTTPIHLACMYRRHEVLNILLENGANANSLDNFGRTPAMIIVQYWPRVYCRWSEFEAESADDFALYLNHVKHQHALSQECMRHLLKYKPDLNTMDSKGMTLLQLCVKYNLEWPIIELASYGVDVNTRNAELQTPLIHAALRGNLVSARALIQRGAIVNIQDSTGSNVLHYICEKESSPGPVRFIESLVDKGCNVNQQNNEGNTPLHIAAQHGHELTVEHTILLGGDSDIKNNDGHSALFVLLDNPRNASCQMSVWRLLKDSRQPSVVDHNGRIPVCLVEGYYADVAKTLIEMSGTPSKLMWLCRHAIRRALGINRLDASAVSKLECPRYLCKYILHGSAMSGLEDIFNAFNTSL